MPASEGYNSARSDVTLASPSPRSSRGKGPRETVRDKILKVLRAEAASRSPVGLNPKIITARIPKDAEGKKPSVGSVKGTLSRMLDERSILKDHDGYKIVPGSFEAAINVSLEREIAVENLPRVHDVQLMFRREDVLKVTAKNNDLAVTLRRLATQIEYSNEDRPPASKKSDKPFIDGYKRTGCLYPSPLADPAAPGQAHNAGGSVGIDLIDRIFNPLDPLSIIQLFYKPERAKADEGRPRNRRKYLLDGGFREK